MTHLLPSWSFVSASVLLCVLTGTVLAQSKDDQLWQQFLKWLPSAPPTENPGTLLAAYRSQLLADGAASADADRQVGAILGMLRTRQDGWQVIFNNVYSNAKAEFSQRPSALLVAAVEGRTPGNALDAGMGQGRNAVFLALKGWQVTGFDVSDTGLAIARRNAEKAGVQLTTVHQNEKQFDYGESRWDLMAFTYVPFPVENQDYVRRLQRALRPGGLIVIESFASSTGSAGRRPVDIDPAALRQAFGEFQIVRFDDVEDTPEWTAQKTRLIRMVARKR
jgi:SAM-dependent methyltransferase